MGSPAVKAGVVESECCHGRAPAHAGRAHCEPSTSSMRASLQTMARTFARSAASLSSPSRISLSVVELRQCCVATPERPSKARIGNLQQLQGKDFRWLR